MAAKIQEKKLDLRRFRPDYGIVRRKISFQDLLQYLARKREIETYWVLFDYFTLSLSWSDPEIEDTELQQVFRQKAFARRRSQNANWIRDIKGKIHFLRVVKGLDMTKGGVLDYWATLMEHYPKFGDAMSLMQLLEFTASLSAVLAYKGVYKEYVHKLHKDVMAKDSQRLGALSGQLACLPVNNTSTNKKHKPNRRVRFDDEQVKPEEPAEEVVSVDVRGKSDDDNTVVIRLSAQGQVLWAKKQYKLLVGSSLPPPTQAEQEQIDVVYAPRNLYEYIRVMDAPVVEELVGFKFLRTLSRRACGNSSCDQDWSDQNVCPACACVNYCSLRCRLQHYAVHRWDCPVFRNHPLSVEGRKQFKQRQEEQLEAARSLVALTPATTVTLV